MQKEIEERYGGGAGAAVDPNSNIRAAGRLGNRVGGRSAKNSGGANEAYSGISKPGNKNGLKSERSVVSNKSLVKSSKGSMKLFVNPKQQQSPRLSPQGSPGSPRRESPELHPPVNQQSIADSARDIVERLEVSQANL